MWGIRRLLKSAKKNDPKTVGRRMATGRPVPTFSLVGTKGSPCAKKHASPCAGRTRAVDKSPDAKAFKTITPVTELSTNQTDRYKQRGTRALGMSLFRRQVCRKDTISLSKIRRMLVPAGPSHRRNRAGRGKVSRNQERSGLDAVQ